MPNKKTQVAKSPEVKRVLFASFWWLEDLMCQVARHATLHGWHLDLQMCLTNSVPSSWSGDGIITTRSGDEKNVRSLLSSASCPVISLNLNSQPHGIPCVGFDVKKVCRLAVEHFLERGFREFGLYSHRLRALYFSQLACAEFRQQVEAKQHTFHALDWLQERGDGVDTWEARQQWLRSRLRDLPKPVAIFAYEPQCAVEIVEACQAERLHVPDEVSVLCMHGIPFFSECCNVPLSSIDVDNGAKARIACDLLESMMNGVPAPKDPILIPPTGISARASTDTLAASNPVVRKAIRFMFDHYADSINIEDVVRASGISRTILFTAFKQDRGQTPHEVLTRIRLNKAESMLRATNAKLHEVAQACGFGHPVGLHQHFKKGLRMSPGAYRKRARQ